MYKVNVHKMDLQPVTTDGAEDVSIQWLVSEDNGGAPNFAMRRFVVEPGGSTPYHTHDWEHEVYTLAGEGIARTEGGEIPVTEGDAMLIEPNEVHCFENTGQTPLVFLCLVPNGPATEGH